MPLAGAGANGSPASTQVLRLLGRQSSDNDSMSVHTVGRLQNKQGESIEEEGLLNENDRRWVRAGFVLPVHPNQSRE